MKIIDAVFVYHLVEHAQVAWHGRYHSHGCGEYEFHFFVDGDGSFLCGKTRSRIAPGKFYIAAPDEFHSIIPDIRARPISYYAVLFCCARTDKEMCRLLDEVFEKRAQDININIVNRLHFEEITRLFLSGDGGFIKSAEFLLISLVFRLYREHGLACVDECKAVAPDMAARRSSGHIHIARALHLMQKNVRNNLGVDALSRILAISPEHFIRIFRHDVKMTPYQYMLHLKIEGASGLLISTTKTVGEIADWFGFENQFHFSRCFKKYTGLSPTDYRGTYIQVADF